MTDTGMLFSMSEGDPPISGNVIKYKDTGIVPFQGIRALVAEKMIDGLPRIEDDQFQPASLDLRLGSRAYRVRASFLPGEESTVMEKIRQLDGFPAIDLPRIGHGEEGGVVFEKGAVYLVELAESARLRGDYVGFANPKSSTGRLDILTRLVTDRATAFNRIPAGYRGPLYLEVIPLTFSIVVRQGTRLTQLRLQRGSTAVSSSEFQRLYERGELINVQAGKKLPPPRGQLVPLTVNLLGKPGEIIGFRAKKNSSKIDLDKIGHYEPRYFWEPIESSNGELDLNKDDFYILATSEDVGVPPQLAAEMVAFDPEAGEFRVHYAGFFDPGFGWQATSATGGVARGSKAVLEVRSYGVSFTLEHGQTVAWLDYKQLATGQTDRRYGGDAIKSNYQGQGVALAKHFKPWTML